MVPTPQNYPRITTIGKEEGLLDLSALKPLPKKIDIKELHALIQQSIKFASIKASEKALKIEKTDTEETVTKICKKGANSLFAYFKKSDPASTFNTIIGEDCRAFAQDLFKKRSGHQATMNAGWRYQFLFQACAEASGRFRSVSDLATGDSDVNISVDTNGNTPPIRLFFSIKNREDTISGSKWGGAIQKLESTAKNDKNKIGAYCCIFALGMHKRPYRTIKRVYSINTEVWPANVIWPFVSGYSYEEIMLEVAQILSKNTQPEITLPPAFLDHFAAKCIKAGLVDANYTFHSQATLIKWLCS